MEDENIKKRSKKHDETKLAINGNFEQVIEALFVNADSFKKKSKEEPKPSDMKK
jgi:hypothetical protein